ncbi:MAG: PLP-dependent aminotransferase family protein [Candidatus Eisenbacteria bacterium]
MPKRATVFELTFPPRDAGATAYRWLCSAVRARILEGSLRPGMRLPGTRDLAEQHGLSRGTIVNAFEQLKAEGYLEGRVGSGTFVSATLPEQWLVVPPEPGTQPLARARRPRRLSSFAKRVRSFPVLEVRPSRAFRPNLPALDLFPAALWAQITARSLRHASSKLFTGCGPMGYPPLRAAVADYLRASRGVRCVPEQVAIVSGVQDALDLVARLFIEPGDRVCVEDPGYPGASIVFEMLGAKISAMALDEQGMVLHARGLRGAKLVYVTPAHQFPLGIAMSLQRRLALLDWARRSNALIFEDDYDSEFRYVGHPLPALQGLDHGGCVLFAGSFSKVLFPSLRLGYMVIPTDLIALFEATKSATSRHPTLLDQVVLSEFITEGHFGRHLRRMRGVYAERQRTLLEFGRQELKGLLEISSVEAGLQTVGWLLAGIDEASATKAAAARQVEVMPLGRFSREHPTPAGLQLGFAAMDPAEIRRGVRELGAALRGVKRSGFRGS